MFGLRHHIDLDDGATRVPVLLCGRSIYIEDTWTGEEFKPAGSTNSKELPLTPALVSTSSSLPQCASAIQRAIGQP